MRLASDVVGEPLLLMFATLTMLAGVLAPTALTAFFAWRALRYARWRGMFDQPGQRRSHAQATPRGGGIAMVFTMIVVAAGVWRVEGSAIFLVFAIALIAVAGIGWIDDHKALSAKVRLAIHLLASLAFAWWLLRDSPHRVHAAHGFALVVVATLWLAACINFWNFMDGSNGLVTIQSAFVAFVIFVWGGFVAGDVFDGGRSWTFMALALFGACLGFLPFNFPNARIFMGDVGSGGLGFACGTLLLVSVAKNPASSWPLLLAPSALLMDASLTLASRILNKRRWTKPHREHLYQWLIRSGQSHARVAMLYLAWCLFVILPGLVAIAHWPQFAPVITVSILMAEATLWLATKRRLLRAMRTR